MTNEYDDDDIDLDEFVTLELDNIKKQLPNYPSKKLCEMIVCHRYFGSYKEIAIMCMEELANRRTNGDDFNFESYIDESLDQLPKFNFKIPDLTDMLRQVISEKTKK